MSDKKTMTLNLTDKEMNALESICASKDLTKTQVMRQALRLYELVDDRIEKGDKIIFENDSASEKARLLLLT